MVGLMAVMMMDTARLSEGTSSTHQPESVRDRWGTFGIVSRGKAASLTSRESNLLGTNGM